MKTINTLIGRFVLAVGLLSMTVTVAQGSATLAETKEFLSRKLYEGEANNHGDPCILYGSYYDNSIRYSAKIKLNLSTIYLDGISTGYVRYGGVIRIKYTKDAEVYKRIRQEKSLGNFIWPDWRRTGTRDGGLIELILHSTTYTTKVGAATKHAAKLCGAKATDPTPPLQFE